MPAAAHSLTSRQPKSVPPIAPACPIGTPSPLQRLAVSIAAAISEELTDIEKLILQAQETAAEEFKKTRLLSRDQAAEHLNLSLSQLDRLTKAGRIPTAYIDSRPRYPMGALQEFIASRIHKPHPAKPALNTPKLKSMERPYDCEIDQEGGLGP